LLTKLKNNSGIAGANKKLSSTFGGVTTDSNTPFKGGAFVAVIVANADYKLTDSFAAGLSLGYRIANVSQMKTNDGLLVTDPFSTSGAALPFDFSGLIISLNGNYSF